MMYNGIVKVGPVSLLSDMADTLVKEGKNYIAFAHQIRVLTKDSDGSFVSKVYARMTERVSSKGRFYALTKKEADDITGIWRIDV